MTTHVRLPDTAASARDRGRYLVAPAAAVLPFAGNPVPGHVAAAVWALIIIGFDAVVMMSLRQAVTPSSLLVG